MSHCMPTRMGFSSMQHRLTCLMIASAMAAGCSGLSSRRKSAVSADDEENAEFVKAGKSAFACKVVPETNYIMGRKAMTIEFRGGHGAFAFEQVQLPAPRRPSNLSGVSMVSRLFPDDKDSTFYATLYVGDNGRLYNCLGGDVVKESGAPKTPEVAP